MNLIRKSISLAFAMIVMILAIAFTPVWVDALLKVVFSDFDPEAAITCFGGMLTMGCVLLPLAANELMKRARDVFYVNGNKAAVKWLTKQIFTFRDLRPKK